MRGLQEELERDIKILQEEFDEEREVMIKTHKVQIKELDDMIDTVREEEQKKSNEANNDHQAFKEENRNKIIEEVNHMRMFLDSK